MSEYRERIWVTSVQQHRTYQTMTACDLDHSVASDDYEYPEYVRADLYAALEAENAKLKEAGLAVLNEETVPIHCGYDSAPGGGNYIWKDAVLTDSDAFAKLRAALT